MSFDVKGVYLFYNSALRHVQSSVQKEYQLQKNGVMQSNRKSASCESPDQVTISPSQKK